MRETIEDKARLGRSVKSMCYEGLGNEKLRVAFNNQVDQWLLAQILGASSVSEEDGLYHVVSSTDLSKDSLTVGGYFLKPRDGNRAYTLTLEDESATWRDRACDYEQVASTWQQLKWAVDHLRTSTSTLPAPSLFEGARIIDQDRQNKARMTVNFREPVDPSEVIRALGSRSGIENIGRNGQMHALLPQDYSPNSYVRGVFVELDRDGKSCLLYMKDSNGRKAGSDQSLRQAEQRVRSLQRAVVDGRTQPVGRGTQSTLTSQADSDLRLSGNLYVSGAAFAIAALGCYAIGSDLGTLLGGLGAAAFGFTGTLLRMDAKSTTRRSES